MKGFVKGIVAAFGILALTESVWACPWCRVQVRSGIYDEVFFENLLILLLPLFILAAIGFGLYHADKIKRKIRSNK